MNHLLGKYNTNIPRYTSYPPVPDWNGEFEQQKWFDNINKCQKTDPKIDIYIHIPYCKKLCWYCGCNRTISKSESVYLSYVELLEKEWQLYKENLKEIKVASIHFGGGTPNTLNAKLFKRLLNNFTPYLTSDFIGSIELDPRLVEDEFLSVLEEFNFKRVSMGIQDFDLNVQRKINRVQPFELVESVFDKLKAKNFESINFDLVYGLAGQTKDSIALTMKKVSQLRPNTIALYSYAHLPNLLKNQRLIKEQDLPKNDTKRQLYEQSKTYLLKNGYEEIGLDHFGLKTSPLVSAKEQKKLMRSFMGYTDKKSDILIGLGVSSISNTNDFYCQNSKDFIEYASLINIGFLAVQRSHNLSDKEIISKNIIQQIMCNKFVSNDILETFEFDTNSQQTLLEMQTDNLIKMNDQGLSVTNLGQAFLRNIANIFDLNNNSQQKYSSSI